MVAPVRVRAGRPALVAVTASGAGGWGDHAATRPACVLTTTRCRTEPDPVFTCRRHNPVVEVEAEVTIAPVQGPLLGRLGVAQPGNREPRPLRAHVLTLGWPAFHDRQMPGRHVALHLDLAAGMFRDALLAPAPNPRHIQFRQTCFRHPDSLPAILAAADRGNLPPLGCCSDVTFGWKRGGTMPCVLLGGLPWRSSCRRSACRAW